MGNSEKPRASDIDELCRQRRQSVFQTGRPAIQDERWGLALSGGGIRSATFCFGLIKSLARNKVFHRFDLMSTVSGGGYIGAMVGRLYQNLASSHAKQAAGITSPHEDSIEHALAGADKRWFGWWLRANGRYLIPRRGLDTMFAAATFCRNLLGVHIELAMLVLLLGSFVAAADMGAWYLLDMAFIDYGPRWIDESGADVISSWPTLWILMPMPIVFAGMCACAYWLLPAGDRMRAGSNAWMTLIVTLAGLVLLAGYWDALREMSRASAPALLSFGLLLIFWLGGAVIVLGITIRAKTQDSHRHRLTSWLATSLLIAVVIFVLGVLDMLAWEMSDITGGLQGVLGIVAFIVAVILRISLPNIANMTTGLPPLTQRSLVLLLNLTGLILLAAVVIFWMAILHRIVTRAIFDETQLNFQLGWARLALVFFPVLILALLNGRNTEFLNRSSLHPFYRSRLVRSYLGAGNGKRFGDDVDPATEYRRDVEFNGPFAGVGEVHDEDDVGMASYVPHRSGCPVHLINVCVNQTRDPKGGLFNQDRKGFMLTLAPEGLARAGMNHWETVKPECALSLGSWTAISGAALSPGLGYGPRSGTAALAMMGGFRLGYWWKNGLRSQDELSKKTPLIKKYLGKYQQLIHELLAQFDGHRSPVWYLTDGGHFENTGAYALLREECKLIVVADCGADPRYAFGDIENLVRKARIDLQAEITFLKPKEPQARRAGKHLCEFGSLNELASNDSTACLALARIDYRRSKATGYMVIVKPNMSSGLPVDLVNFRADNPLFPQEPTADQFFSEAQWESYYQLGTILGDHLKANVLRRIGRIAELAFVVDDGVSLSEAGGEARVSPKRVPSRILASGAVTATVSFGAVTTLAVSAAQAVYNEQKERSAPMDQAAFREIVDLYMQWVGEQQLAEPETTNAKLISALVQVAGTTCNSWRRAAYQKSEIFQEILAAAEEACGNSDDSSDAPCRLFNKPGGPLCLKGSKDPDCAPKYWIRDYSISKVEKVNCGAPPAQAPSVASENDGQSAPVRKTEREKTCTGHTVYIHVYGPERRDYARDLRNEWRKLGASVPPIDDVWATARSRNQPRSIPFKVPTILYHDSISIDCANALRREIGHPLVEVGPLTRGKLTSKVIEVWLPREAAK